MPGDKFAGDPAEGAATAKWLNKQVAAMPPPPTPAEAAEAMVAAEVARRRADAPEVPPAGA